jgi:Ca2+-binding EF-hand superfamily protein
MKNSSDPLSSIPANHLHTMRESFSVLDRSNTGAVTPADVATALSDLGLDSSSSTLATYFPPGTSSFNLGSYLGMLTHDLTRLSRPDELAAAFAAFDDDDSGQIDVHELREALLGTATEEGVMMNDSEVDAALEGFIGRRVLKKGQTGAGLGGKKEVFRYGDFTASIWGSGNANAEQQSVSN